MLSCYVLCVYMCVLYIYIYIYIYIHISFFAFNKLCDQNSQVDFLDASFKTGFNLLVQWERGEASYLLRYNLN